MTKRFNNTIVAALWQNGDGNIRSMVLDEYSVNKLKELASQAEVGGKIVVQTLSAESREKVAEKKDKELAKIETHYLKFIPKSEVDEYTAYREKNRKGL